MAAAVEEITAHGAEALALATQLFGRARLADPVGGIWEAADVQWWWRQARASDAVDQPFWLDDQGPVAGVLMTSWRDDRWQCDPVVLPSAADIDPERVWAHARDLIHSHARGVIEVNLHDDDPTFTDMAADLGLNPSDQGTIGWMDPQDRPAPRAPAKGFTIFDRALRAGSPHPMIVRNGPAIAERLQECSLYDPGRDLAVETMDVNDTTPNALDNDCSRTDSRFGLGVGERSEVRGQSPSAHGFSLGDHERAVGESRARHT